MEISLVFSDLRALTIIGLIADIIGVCLIGYEVFFPYSGERIEQSRRLEDIDSPKPVISDSYAQWGSRERRAAKWGLLVVIIGFSLQAIGVFLG